ncbi:MAG: hypothetical protein KatS3mg057_2808 [Herpetosiphonaceae bacterium]|nr:MAG: hypothetical protein KatS3mg057_2808 [Herpetosiphonaceae bacterium]
MIGIAADGSGYGLDGAIWGCEVLKADLVGFERLAHLAYVPLPGGEQAVRQPWRMAAVHLHAAYGAAFAELPLPLVRAIAPARWRPLAQLIERGLNSPPTSSLGRLFDAVAALAGVSPAELTGSVSYEGQAAAQLEALAATAEDRSGEALYPFAIVDGAPVQLDIRPLLRALVDDLLHGTPAALVALRFHHSVAELLAACCLAVSRRIGIRHVALSGGVFQNRLLLERLVARLAALDFEVYVNRRVPPNDGGLSLGQAAVAAARLERGMLS